MFIRRKSTRKTSYKTAQNTLSKGSRIINLAKLQEYTDTLRQHSLKCTGSIMLYGETRHGLATILKGHCSTCNHTIADLPTSKKFLQDKVLNSAGLCSFLQDPPPPPPPPPPNNIVFMVKVSDDDQMRNMKWIVS